MARIFITGSADGLGQLAAEALIAQGHQVVVHARNEKRAREALEKVLGAETVLTADLSNIEETKQLAAKVNALGDFDAVIQNAGVYRASAEEILTVNTLAPYILTFLIERPRRLIYLSSGMHRSAEANLDDLIWKRRSWAGAQAYAESKLHDVLLAFAMARRWPTVFSIALEPGWVATRMGGSGASDDLDQGTGPRSGWPSARTRRRAPPANISIICASARRTRRSATRRCRGDWSRRAGESRA